jgi:hypothetical protein
VWHTANRRFLQTAKLGALLDHGKITFPKRSWERKPCEENSADYLTMSTGLNGVKETVAGLPWDKNVRNFHALG